MQETYQVTITYDGSNTGVKVVWPDDKPNEEVIVRLSAFLSAINEGDFEDLLLGAVLQSKHPVANSIVTQYKSLQGHKHRMKTRALVPPRMVLKPPSHGDYEDD